jgi:hypothetical protein
MRKSKTKIIYRYAETRMVLTEKAPFGVFLNHEEVNDDDLEEPYLVRKCTSLNELMTAFKKGLSWEEKIKFNERCLNPKGNLYEKNIPEDFYIVVKGFNRGEIGRPLRIKHTTKASKK